MAQQEFLAAVRYDPKNAGAHKNIGMIYFTKGDKERAREHFMEMLKYDPNYLKDAGISAIVSQLGLLKK
jgi:tetratricopeptide (TPR) repeat protein